MNNCTKCGAKLQENARFCDSCGSPVMQVRQEMRQQNFVSEAIPQQNTYEYNPNTYAYNSAYNPGYQKPAAKPKLNYILFIFVTSIIFFSYVSLRLFVRLVLPGTWIRTGFTFYDVTSIIYTALALIVFAIMLAQLIVAVNCFKKRNGPMEEMKNPAANLSGLTLASFILSLALLVIAIVSFASIDSISSYFDYDYNTISIATALSFVIVFFIYDIAFLVFAGINMAKSRGFKRQVNELYEKQQVEGIE